MGKSVVFCTVAPIRFSKEVQASKRATGAKYEQFLVNRGPGGIFVLCEVTSTMYD